MTVLVLFFSILRFNEYSEDAVKYFREATSSVYTHQLVRETRY